MENTVIYLHPKHIARAWAMLTPEQQAQATQDASIADTPPVIFPCPPICPPVSA